MIWSKKKTFLVSLQTILLFYLSLNFLFISTLTGSDATIDWQKLFMKISWKKNSKNCLGIYFHRWNFGRKRTIQAHRQPNGSQLCWHRWILEMQRNVRNFVSTLREKWDIFILFFFCHREAEEKDRIFFYLHWQMEYLNCAFIYNCFAWYISSFKSSECLSRSKGTETMWKKLVSVRVKILCFGLRNKLGCHRQVTSIWLTRILHSIQKLDLNTHKINTAESPFYTSFYTAYKIVEIFVMEIVHFC